MAGFAFATAGITLPTSFQWFWGSSNKEDDTKKGDGQQPIAKSPVAPSGPLRFINGVCLIPHDEKAYKGGEDAYCVTDTLIAMADGVGGWANRGVDPGLFSKQLTKDIEAIYTEHGTTKTLKEILIEAV